jgi:hypothetical protein
MVGGVACLCHPSRVSCSSPPERDRPRAAEGRLIHIVDAATVLKAGVAAKNSNRLWLVHSAFELPPERFGFLELTDERGGERMDRVPVVPGEIRICDSVICRRINWAW